MSKYYKGKLFSNFFSLSIIQGTNFLIPLLVMPYVISRIGVSWFGVISVAQVVMVYLSTVSDYGFNLTATRDIALIKDGGNTEMISRIFFTVSDLQKSLLQLYQRYVLLVLVSVVPFFRGISIVFSWLYLRYWSVFIGQLVFSRDGENEIYNIHVFCLLE